RTLAAQRAFPDQGLDADVLMQATRFFGDNLRRVAESQVDFFMSVLIEPLLAAGQSPSKVLAAVAPVSAALQPAGRGLVRWVERRARGQAAWGRRDVPLREPHVRRGLLHRPGGASGRAGASSRPVRRAGGPRGLPGRRLLRADGERGLADRELRPASRGPGGGGGGRPAGAAGPAAPGG